jgi:hypothetical protein
LIYESLKLLQVALILDTPHVEDNLSLSCAQMESQSWELHDRIVSQTHRSNGRWREFVIVSVTEFTGRVPREPPIFQIWLSSANSSNASSPGKAKAWRSTHCQSPRMDSERTRPRAGPSGGPSASASHLFILSGQSNMARLQPMGVIHPRSRI